MDVVWKFYSFLIESSLLLSGVDFFCFKKRRVPGILRCCGFLNLLHWNLFKIYYNWQKLNLLKKRDLIQRKIAWYNLDYTQDIILDYTSMKQHSPKTLDYKQTLVIGLPHVGHPKQPTSIIRNTQMFINFNNILLSKNNVNKILKSQN